MNNFIIAKEKSYYNYGVTETSYIKNFIAETKTSCPELHKILSDDCWKGDGLRLKVKRLGLPLAIPTTGGLRSIADKYFHKYGIEIKVVSFDINRDPDELLASVLKKELQNSTPRSIGIIFEQKETVSHVVPLLLKIEKEPKVLVLDALGIKFHEINRLALVALHSLKIPSSRCKNAVQAGPLSCRVHALVCLRNALLTLKENQGSALKPFESCRVYTSNEQMDSEFELPPEWGGATNQIFRPQVNVDRVLNPRQKYSKVKGKYIETIQESRLRHQITACFEITLTLSANSLTKNIDENSFKLPGVKILKYGNDQLALNWSLEKEINGYMLHKGRKEQEKADLAFALQLSSRQRQEEEDSALARREGIIFGLENSLVSIWRTAVNAFPTPHVAFEEVIKFIEEYGFAWTPDGLYFLNAKSGLLITQDEITDILGNPAYNQSHARIFEAIDKHIKKISKGYYEQF